MSKRNTFVSHVEGAIYLKLHQDFLHICNYDHCEAFLLNYYEYRYNIIRSSVEEKIATNKNFRPSASDCFLELSPMYLQEATLGLFGRTKIIQANESLFKKGFITIETNFKTITKICLNIDFLNSKLKSIDYVDLKEGYKSHILKKKKPSSCSETNKKDQVSCSETNKPCSETNKSEPFSYSETNTISNTLNKEYNNNISSEEDSNNHDCYHADKMSVKLYEQNIDGNCTFPILDSTEPIYDVKAKETEPKGKSKPKETQPKDELKSKFRVEFESLWNKAGKPKLTHIGFIAINRLYEVYGYDKGCFIRDYIIEMYGSNEKSIGFKKNHENAIEFYKDPNNEEPRFLIDFWNTMERFSRPNYPEPFVAEFNTEEALYASWEWYYKGKGLEGVEIVKSVREKIKEINHPRFNKY
jgi:hypothetical protein